LNSTKFKLKIHPKETSIIKTVSLIIPIIITMLKTIITIIIILILIIILMAIIKIIPPSIKMIKTPSKLLSIKMKTSLNLKVFIHLFLAHKISINLKNFILLPIPKTRIQIEKLFLRSKNDSILLILYIY
jgi:hypothetical protein